MNSITETCVVRMPKDIVFEFLSNIENIPKWATRFVKKLTIVNGKYMAQTPFGDVFIKLESDKRSGLVEIYAGPTENSMTPAYMRIISLPNSSTAIMFTFFQYDSTPNDVWEIFCDWIKIEVENIRQHFS